MCFPSISTKVARLHLPKLGARLTELTGEQAAYIGVDKKGPFQAGLLSLLGVPLLPSPPVHWGRRCEGADEGRGSRR